MVDKWGTSFSRITLGFAAGVMRPQPNVLEQHGTPILVARIPKAPLFTLIALNLVYAAAGIGIAVFAALSLDSQGGVGAIRQRVSIPGLVAQFFEDENPRVNSKGSETEGVKRLFIETDGEGLVRRIKIERVIGCNEWRLKRSD